MIDVVALLGDRKFEAHSSIVLTYALDLLLYDDFVRRHLRTSGAMNQIVFCDGRCYDRELNSIGAARHLGRTYSITPVHQEGAFHPKIYLLLGLQRGRLLVGSGNATLGGLTRNGELFGAFEFDEGEHAAPHSAFGVALGLVRSLAANAIPLVRLQLERALARSNWINSPPTDDGRRLLVAGPGRRPMLDQLREAIGPGRIDRVLVCSASFDRHLLGLERLSELAANGRVTCLVQPDHVKLDGNSVRRLGTKVDWKELSLTHLRRKADSGDVFSHAKLLIITLGDREYVAYGSANASSPALLGGARGNIETLVLLPPAKPGSLLDRLGLRACLEAPSLYASLLSQVWPDDEIEDDYATQGLRLCGVSVDQGKITATFSSTINSPTLRLGMGPLPPPGVTAIVVTLLHTEGQQWTAALPAGSGTARVAWVVDERDMPMSNTIAITWREVAETLSGGGHGRKFDEAVAAMLDGQLLSTALYSLLDSVSDFTHGGAMTADKEIRTEEPKSVTPRTEESFYSDRVAVIGSGLSLSADRMDLDLLGSLVKPLAAPTPDEPDEGWQKSEELERLELGAIDGWRDGGPSTMGSESLENTGNVLDVSGPAIEKSARRLAQRLERAASAAEDLLGVVSNEPLPTGAIARQLWMMHVAAFLAGREVTTKDGPATCLSPDAFACYAIRMAHALAGGRKGGLLARLPASAWSAHDGESLQRGLAFAWTCVTWAAVFLRRYWESVAERTESANALAVAAPELVAARFILAASIVCPQADDRDLTKRLPAVSLLTPAYRAESIQRVKRIANMIRRVEEANPSIPSTPSPPVVEPGTLVYNAKLGVAVAARNVGSAIELIDLSQAVRAHEKHAKGRSRSPPPYLRTFRQMVMMIPMSDGLNHITWRAPRELVAIWQRSDRA